MFIEVRDFAGWTVSNVFYGVNYRGFYFCDVILFEFFLY